MTAFQSVASALSRVSRRDIFARQGIPAEGLVGPGALPIYIDQQTATRIIAVHAAWSLLADAVALLPIDVVQAVGDRRVPQPSPEWLTNPDPFDPSVTTEDHFTQVVVSMASDGNAFTLALPEVADAASLTVLDPTRVEVKKAGAEPKYRYHPPDGGLEVLGADQIIHISRLRRPGQLRGLSPIDEAGQALGKMRAADQMGNRVFTNAVILGGMVTVPGPMTSDELGDLRKQIQEQYTGANAGKFGIFANGSTFGYPEIDIEKMSLMAMLGWGVIEVARIYHIPPHMLGDNSPGSMSHGSVEQQYIEFTDMGVRPYVERIEPAYRRLLPVDHQLRFNLDAKVRADIFARYQAYALALQNKIASRDEIRAKEDWPAADEALGVDTENGGFLETPNNNFVGQPPVVAR